MTGDEVDRRLGLSLGSSLFLDENVIARPEAEAIPHSRAGDCFDLWSRSDMNGAIFLGGYDEQIFVAGAAR